MSISACVCVCVCPSIPVPFIWFAFSSLSPSHTSFSLPFFHVFPCFTSCRLTPFGSQVAQVLIMRFGSFFAPVHLVPLVIATTHTFVPSVLSFMSSSLSSCLPSGRRVCVPLEVTGIHLDCTDCAFRFFAGGRGTIASPLPTKTLATGGDTRPDQSGVPAVLPESIPRGPCF